MRPDRLRLCLMRAREPPGESHLACYYWLVANLESDSTKGRPPHCVVHADRSGIIGPIWGAPIRQMICALKSSAVGVGVTARNFPRVARGSPPWALRRNPFEILGNFRKALGPGLEGVRLRTPHCVNGVSPVPPHPRRGCSVGRRARCLAASICRPAAGVRGNGAAGLPLPPKRSLARVRPSLNS